MTKVLLISSNRVQRPYPVPPLGLCLLAEHLSPDFEVRIFDAMFRHPSELTAVIADFQPDYVGLSIRNVDAMSMYVPASYLEEIRTDFVEPIRRCTEAPLVLGGSGFSILPRAILGMFGADYGVVGEGEAAFRELLESLEAGHTVVDIAGVVSPNMGNAPFRSPLELEAAKLGPSRIERWLDFDPYRARGSYPVQTKRGCTHQCIYCTYPLIEGRKWRLRSPQTIAREIAEASEALGPVTFEMVDSTFNDPPGHAEAICQALIDLGKPLRLRTMGINPRGVTGELLDLMKRAGFVQMDCTPDSAAPAVLNQLHKGFTREQLEAAARRIRVAGIPCMWFFLFGGPCETTETFDQTLDFIDRFVRPDDMVYMAAGLRVYPGTPLYRLARFKGMISDDDDLTRPNFFTSPDLGSERLKELIRGACATRPNCVPEWETTPSPEMIRRALALRERLDPEVPMFRVLIRVRREMMGL